jgi:hypothetical protein
VTEVRVIDAEPAPHPDIADRLTEVCNEVAQDKISSVAIAVVYRDGTIGTSWSQARSMSLLIGAVARLEAALIRTADCGD